MAKLEKIEKTVTLPNGLQVKYSVEKLGQCEASESDNVQVKLTVYLHQDVEQKLTSTLRFCGRLNFVGEALVSCWGAPCGDWRTRGKIFIGSTYKEAFQQAEEYAQKEIPLLAEAIEKRMKALEKAEKSLENFYR